jgi:hypothetical protein
MDPNGEHQHEHKDVYENYPGLFNHPTELDAMGAKLDDERKALRLWATKKLRSKMLEWAHALNLTANGNRVNKCADVSKSWETDPCDTNAKKMYEIMFGDFEGSNAAWSHEWELEVLKEHWREHVKEHSSRRREADLGGQTGRKTRVGSGVPRRV